MTDLNVVSLSIVIKGWLVLWSVIIYRLDNHEIDFESDTGSKVRVFEQGQGFSDGAEYMV